MPRKKKTPPPTSSLIGMPDALQRDGDLPAPTIPRRDNFTRLVRDTVCGDDGSRAHRTIEQTFNGEPHLVLIHGHEQDSYWVYPMIGERVVAGPSLALAGSQTVHVAPSRKAADAVTAAQGKAASAAPDSMRRALTAAIRNTDKR